MTLTGFYSHWLVSVRCCNHIILLTIELGYLYVSSAQAGQSIRGVIVIVIKKMTVISALVTGRYSKGLDADGPYSQRNRLR